MNNMLLVSYSYIWSKHFSIVIFFMVRKNYKHELVYTNDWYRPYSENSGRGEASAFLVGGGGLEG